MTPSVHSKAFAETRTGCRIQAFQDDKGGKFIGHAWELFHTSRIEVQHSTCNLLQQNGVAERANHTIVEVIAAALAESGLPRSFWGEALSSFVHIWNRLLSSSASSRSQDTTPYKLWYSSKPDLAHLCIWGCRAYAHIQRDKCNKPDWHMVLGIFIGYPPDFRRWKLTSPL